MTEQKRKLPIEDLPHTRTDDFRFIHSNSASITETFWDMSLIFGEATAGPGVEPHVQDQVSVSMSWEHAKVLCRVLSERIAAYERENDASIRTPKSAEDQSKA